MLVLASPFPAPSIFFQGSCAQPRVRPSNAVFKGVGEALWQDLGQTLRHEKAPVALPGPLPRQVHVQPREHLEQLFRHSGVLHDPLLVPHAPQPVLRNQNPLVLDNVLRGVQQHEEDVAQPLDVEDDKGGGQLGEAARDHPLCLYFPG